MNRAYEYNRMTRRLAVLGADISHTQTEVNLPAPEQMDDEQLLRWTRALEGTIDTRSELMSVSSLVDEYGTTIDVLERRGLLEDEHMERVGRLDSLIGDNEETLVKSGALHHHPHKQFELRDNKGLIHDHPEPAPIHDHPGYKDSQDVPLEEQPQGRLLNEGDPVRGSEMPGGHETHGGGVYQGRDAGYDVYRCNGCGDTVHR